MTGYRENGYTLWRFLDACAQVAYLPFLLLCTSTPLVSSALPSAPLASFSSPRSLLSSRSPVFSRTAPRLGRMIPGCVHTPRAYTFAIGSGYDTTTGTLSVASPAAAPPASAPASAPAPAAAVAASDLCPTLWQHPFGLLNSREQSRRIVAPREIVVVVVVVDARATRVVIRR